MRVVIDTDNKLIEIPHGERVSIIKIYELLEESYGQEDVENWAIVSGAPQFYVPSVWPATETAPNINPPYTFTCNNENSKT